MIKDCYVKLNNEYVTVIDYDGIDVQIPAIKREARTVKVILENGKYTVVGDNYTEPVKETVKEDKPIRRLIRKQLIRTQIRQEMLRNNGQFSD